MLNPQKKLPSLNIVVNLTLNQFLEQGRIKKERHKNVMLHLIKKGNEIEFCLNINERITKLMIKMSQLHIKHLADQGLFAVSLIKPHCDFLFATTSQRDNLTLENFITGKPRNCAAAFEETRKKLAALQIKLKVTAKQANEICVDLTEKNIKELPVEFGDVSTKIVRLDSNWLGPYPNYWSWAFGEIRHNLHTLSLDNNNLVRFPMEILALKQLRILSLSRNDLREIPSSLFCSRRCLHSLIIAENINLVSIPAITKPFRLLNVLNCMKLYKPRAQYITSEDLFTPSLKYCAGLVVLRHHLQYEPWYLPRTLITELDNHYECSKCKDCVPLPFEITLLPAVSTTQELVANSRTLNFKSFRCRECVIKPFRHIRQ